MSRHRIVQGLLLLGLTSAACTEPARGSGTADSAGTSADGADGAGSSFEDASADGRSGDRVAPPDDVKALLWLDLSRKGSNQAASATWPGAQSAIWPGYALHKVPTYLVILGDKLKPVRGYLVGWPVPPLGATAVTLPGLKDLAWRYDAGFIDIGAGERVIFDHEVAGTSALVVTYSASRDQSDLEWIDRLGEQYMTRLRLVEAVWQPVAGCGQNKYPRFEHAIALLFLECAVLAEAYAAKDPATAEQHMREWSAVRDR